jgi:hypothetical protein
VSEWQVAGVKSGVRSGVGQWWDVWDMRGVWGIAIGDSRSVEEVEGF